MTIFPLTIALHSAQKRSRDDARQNSEEDQFNREPDYAQLTRMLAAESPRTKMHAHLMRTLRKDESDEDDCAAGESGCGHAAAGGNDSIPQKNECSRESSAKKMKTEKSLNYLKQKESKGDQTITRMLKIWMELHPQQLTILLLQYLEMIFQNQE